MDSYVGGRVFSNRERIPAIARCPKQSHSYQEWDVRHKSPAKRDAERIVTGAMDATVFQWSL